MSTLATESLISIPRGAPPLDESQQRDLLAQLPGWQIQDGQLGREVTVKNFAAALALVNQIGELAEGVNHHPDLCIQGWNHVRIELSTHSIGGLSRNDFILAAKIDQLPGVPSA